MGGARAGAGAVGAAGLARAAAPLTASRAHGVRWQGEPRGLPHLPEPIRLEDTVAEVDVRPVPDPDGGINPESLFAVRYGIA